MKYFTGLIIFFLLLIPAVFSQNTVSSKISEVVVFPEQALVTRQAEATLNKGLNQLEIDLEAFSVDPDSIQVKVYGQGEIHSVQLKQVYLKEMPQDKIKNLTKELEDLKDKKDSLLKEQDVLDKKKQFLNSLVDFSESQVPEDIKTTFPNPRDLKEALNFLSQGYGEINLKASELEQSIRELDKQIKATEEDLNSLRQPSKKSKGVIEIAFNSSESQKASIEATYLVYGAFWQPLYKADIPPELTEIDLTMFSKLFQKTGEDWKEIKLAVSNVIPLKGITLPSLNSWYLDANLYRKDKALLFNKMMAASTPEEGISLDEEQAVLEPEEAKFVQAEAKELPLSFEYQLPQAVSLNSQDKETVLPLFSKTLKGDFVYYSAPKLSPMVFLIGRVVGDKEFLAGALNVYFAGRFIGKTMLENKKAGEAFELNLGADRQVVIKREKLKDKIQETFFKKLERQTIIRNLAFKITAENLKDKPIKLELVDVIPVSQSDRIEVKDILLNPKPDKENYLDKEGLNLWIVNLQPGEKKEVEISFTITYPKDMPISGL